ncbi:NUDIX domain-containing protein [Phytoactinopolyspora endophytica]|uniref:NUDIX domain-containing protein n=1 Tax=Phytoactinopolyspora endophytica TaxID=1642495 RepID=UPI00101D9C4B|nr:NUDIX domain-containing protein [Phytoactinopolyspora endophytica]
MPISPYIRRLRQSIGNDLILLPSVAVLPRDDDGRILLVKQSDTGTWATIGGAVEVDEDPATAAVREAEEEAGVVVELTRIITALGGPQFRLTYPNGDKTAYVSLVYEARVIGGSPRPDHDETIDVGWFHPHELARIDLGDFAQSSFTALGFLNGATG